MDRKTEPELMDLPEEVTAYADANFDEVNARFVARVVELVASSSPRMIIDIGCGPGDITRALAVALPEARVVGVDASQPMLALAQERSAGISNIRFELGDAKDLRMPAMFDAIVSNSLLHHLPDPAGFWRSIARIGRPGALVIIRDLARPATEAEAAGIVATHAAGETAILQQEYHRSLLAAFTPEEIRSQLKAAGLGGLDVQMVSDRHLDIVGTLKSAVD